MNKTKSGCGIVSCINDAVAATASALHPQPYSPLKLPYQFGAVPEHSFFRSTCTSVSCQNPPGRSAAAAEGDAKTDGADGAGDCGRFEDDFFERSFCGEVDHYSYEEEDEEEEDDDGEVSGGCR